MGKRELNNKKSAKSPGEAPPKKRRLRKGLALLFALALVGGIASVALLQNFRGIDHLRRLIVYNRVKQSGQNELFRYDNDRTAVYAMLGDDLVIVSATRLRLLDRDGEELWSRTVNFDHPAVICGTQTALVYDVGGKEAWVLGPRGLLRELDGECENGVLSASLNASDYLTLTVLKSGYRSAVTVYDRDGTPVFTFNSSERYVSDACVLNDNRTLAAVTLGEAEGVFASMLSLYPIDREQSAVEMTLGGSMVLSLQGVGGGLAAMQDDRVTLFGADGSLRGSHRYEYTYLRGRAMGSGFMVLLLSRYRSGNSLRILSLDEKGEVLGKLDARQEVIDVSAAGRYIAVLYGDSLTVYDSGFTEVSSLSGTDFAKRCIMRPDGTALLLGAQHAWLYIP